MFGSAKVPYQKKKKKNMHKTRGILQYEIRYERGAARTRDSGDRAAEAPDGY